jgi:gamma-glutamylputrescine oxidase
MNLSYWEKETYFSNIDVAVGSGIVGLSTAYYLKQKNPSLKIAVFERGILPSGASTKNAGFCCFGSISELLDDLSKNSENEVFGLVEKRWKGLQNLRELIGDNNMDYECNGGYELFKKEDEELFEKCSEKLNYFNQSLTGTIGKNVFKNCDYKSQQFGFSDIEHIIECSYEAQINTGKMMNSLLKLAIQNDIQIINSTDIKHLNENEINTEITTSNGFSFHARKTVVCTNGFARQLLPETDVSPARAQVLITKPIENLKIKGTFHYDCGYYYFRNIDNRILLGGGRNIDFKGETTYELGQTEEIQNSLNRMLKNIIVPYADFEIDHRWSGIMGVGTEKRPIIKQLSKNIFCAVRMGGMGIAIGSLVGKEAADMILNS